VKITSNLSLLAEMDVTRLDVGDTFTNINTSLNDMSRLQREKHELLNRLSDGI